MIVPDVGMGWIFGFWGSIQDTDKPLDMCGSKKDLDNWVPSMLECANAKQA